MNSPSTTLKTPMCSIRKGGYFARRFFLLLFCCCLFFCCARAEETTPPPHPLMEPNAPVEKMQLPRRFFNLLILGIDYGNENYRGSGFKSDLTDCHTDAVMVLALDLDEHKLSMVSLPRDTVTYVPGVRGIYKLNAAINCGSTLNGGLDLVCASVSRILGGIPIDAYCAVDFAAMIAIGDAIGGVDFELEMGYSHYARTYPAGWQHLDGLGIADYFRARTNASVGKTDLSRTNRQRELLMTILQKVMSEPDAATNIINLLAGDEQHFFTNISTLQTFLLMPHAARVDFAQVAGYVLEGNYLSGMGNWNFTFTNRENRKAVIKTVWDVDAADLPYVSKEYTEWLESSGFKGVHAIVTAENILSASTNSEAVETAKALLEETKAAFTLASYTQKGGDILAYNRLLTKMKNATDKAAKENGVKGYIWYPNRNFYANPLINEVQLEWR